MNEETSFAGRRASVYKWSICVLLSTGITGITVVQDAVLERTALAAIQ